MMIKKQLGLFIILCFCFSLGFSVVVNTDESIELMTEERESINELQDQALLLNSLKSFVEGNATAADEMEYIIQKRETSARKRMNNLLEKLAVETTTKDKKEELVGGSVDFVSKHLNKALVYFYEAKYWLTVEECNSVIKVQPGHALAWIRRGSGFYMLGNYDAAKSDWGVALQLNPAPHEEEDIQTFLAKIEDFQVNY
jgi:tetratricopeptide (TPR) repeat protein